MAVRRKPKTRDPRDIRRLRRWWAAGGTVILVGGAWVAATGANASPLFGSHHHHQSQQAAANAGNGNTGNANTGTGTANTGSAATGGGTSGNNTSGAQGTGTGQSGQMQSHTNVMQEWTAPAGSTATPGNAQVNQTNANAGISATTSTNWAGYVDTGAKFTSVAANWTQPTANCTAAQTFSSFWVGIDGDGTNSVEQTGSEADCSNGQPVYFGWFEMFPAAPVEYNKPVAAGDAMSASVTTSGNGTFTLTLTDATQGWNQVTTQTSNTAQLGSAEVVAEAPTGQNGVLPLTNFGTANFTNATANGTPIGTTATPSSLTMVSAAGVTEATPSALTNNTAFSVAWNAQ
jgi:peptidase A4-like protein